MQLFIAIKGNFSGLFIYWTIQSRYLIIWLEITAEGSVMDFWTVVFSNWHSEVSVWNFVSEQSLSKPHWLSYITKKYQSLSNQSFQHNSTQTRSLNLTTMLSFEPRFFMFFINIYYIKLQRSFIEIALRHGCSPVDLLHNFRKPFPKNTSGRLLLHLFKKHLFAYVLQTR